MAEAVVQGQMAMMTGAGSPSGIGRALAMAEALGL